ncbi:hypothetical protein GOODEAATRI_024542, partial [Goodea atripinnis]
LGAVGPSACRPWTSCWRALHHCQHTDHQGKAPGHSPPVAPSPELLVVELCPSWRSILWYIPVCSPLEKVDSFKPHQASITCPVKIAGALFTPQGGPSELTPYNSHCWLPQHAAPCQRRQSD